MASQQGSKGFLAVLLAAAFLPDMYCLKPDLQSNTVDMSTTNVDANVKVERTSARIGGGLGSRTVINELHLTQVSGENSGGRKATDKTISNSERLLDVCRSKKPDYGIFDAMLKKDDINVNYRGAEARTPLMEAALADNKRMVEELSKHPKIDFHLKDADGNTAFMLAVWRGRENVVEHLLPFVNNINEKNDKGNTAIALAVKEWKKNPNVCPHQRERYRDRLAIIRMLLERPDVDLLVPDDQGKTAWDHIRVSEILVDALGHAKFPKDATAALKLLAAQMK